MKVDTQELKARLTYHNLSYREVADSAGISVSALNSKLRSGDFKISEIHKLMKVIPLTMKEVQVIFFAD